MISGTVNRFRAAERKKLPKENWIEVETVETVY
jgi:hypothetical protein